MRARVQRWIIRTARVGVRHGWLLVAGAGAVAAALVRALGGAAQVMGVGIGTWAAWDVEPIAGRLVLAGGLLFLGGAVGRIVREVRNVPTR